MFCLLDTRKGAEETQGRLCGTLSFFGLDL